jgi:hypothetical protein
VSWRRNVVELEALGERKLDRFLDAVHLATDTAPNARTRSITSRTSTSGAEAPAVRPMRDFPSNHSGLSSSAESTM